MEWRHIPGDDPHQHMARFQAWVAANPEAWMKAANPACGFSYSVELEMPGMGLPADHELATVVKQLAGSNDAGKVAYGTEGGFYQEAGIPTIICGPGDIAQAHQPDEYVTEDQLAACDGFVRRLVERLLV